MLSIGYFVTKFSLRYQTPNGQQQLISSRFIETKNLFSDITRQTLIELQGDGNMPANKYKTVIKTAANICSTGIWVNRIFPVSIQQSVVLTRVIF